MTIPQGSPKRLPFFFGGRAPTAMPAFQKSQTGVGASAFVPIGLKNFAGAGVGLFLTISGTATASVQVTGDPSPSSGGNWINHPDLTNQTASGLGNLAFTATAVRVNVTSGSGTAILSVAQADYPGP